MSSQPWCFEHCLYKSSPCCDHSAVVLHFQFTQNTKYIFAFSQHDKIHVAGVILWIVYLGRRSYFKGCFSYDIPVILQYTYIETGCFVIREFMKKRYSIRTTNPGFARKERRKNGFLKCQIHRQRRARVRPTAPIISYVQPHTGGG